MRTIKFRGKTELTGEWVYGFFSMGSSVRFEHPKQDERIAPRYLIDDGLLHDVIPETVGQFTGLTDRNGKEIYEGDIVSHPWKDPIFGDLVETGQFVHSAICFNKGAFVVNYRLDGEYIYLQDFVRLKCLEIIGNIHDNPELLKGGDK